MMKRISLAIAAAAALVLPAAAQAQTVRQFNRKDLTIQVDPALSYIFYRMGTQSAMIFIRKPVEADFGAWRDARAKAFDKAMKKYQKEYRAWQSAMKQWDQQGDGGHGGMTKPVKPVMPTDDNFAFPVIEFLTMTEGLITPAFFKEKPLFGFLLAVQPGTYTVYGSVMAFGGNFVGVCMCMGTVEFDAKPGEIVDVGYFGVPGVAAGGKLPRIQPYAKPLETEIRPFDGPLPARLQGLPVHPAVFRAAGKLPNYFGVTIDRLHPMPGVLAYKRDTIIDVRTGLPLANQSATAE